jgi:hypothetical protein
MAGRTEDVAVGRWCECHPDVEQVKRRWVPFYGTVTVGWYDRASGVRLRCAPLETESNS